MDEDQNKTSEQEDSAGEEHAQNESQESGGDTNEETKEESKPKKEKNAGMAVVAYILFFVPLLTDAKDDPFVKYHVKQGLVLFILAIAVSIVMRVLMLWMIGNILSLGVIILAVIGIMNALNGKKEPLPLIGQYANKFNI